MGKNTKKEKQKENSNLNKPSLPAYLIPQVNQSNVLAREGVSDATLNEWKIMLWLMSLQDSKKDDYFLPIQVDYEVISAFFKGCGSQKMTGSLKGYITKLFDDLLTKTYRIIGEDDSYEGYTWFSSIKTTGNFVSGNVTFTFNSTLVPHLLNLNGNYSRAELGSHLSFKTAYSIRLYSMLNSEKYRGTATYEINHFKRCIGAYDSVSQTAKYNNFKDFKKRVLNPSIKEINEKSDINVSIEMIRCKEDARRIYGFKFKIVEKETFVPEFCGPPIFSEVSAVFDKSLGRCVDKRIVKLKYTPADEMEMPPHTHD